MQQQTTHTNTGSGRISRRAKKQETFLDSQDIYKMSFYYGRHFLTLILSYWSYMTNN